MTPTRTLPSTGPRALSASLWYLAAAIVTVALVEGPLLVAANPEYPAVVAIFPIVGLLYSAMGLVAWWRRPSNRVGGVLVLGGLFWMLSGLSNATQPVLIAVGQITATLPFAVLAHLLLVFPTGRTLVRGSRVVIATAYATTLFLQAPIYLFGPDHPGSPLLVALRPDVVAMAQAFQRGCAAAIVIATAVLVVRRYRASTPAVRRALAPVAAYGLFALALVPLSANVISPLTGMDPITLFVVQAIVLGFVPVALLLGVLRGGFARTGEIVELGAWFRSHRDRSELTKALGDSLGDPTVELAFWIEEQSRHVDLDGGQVDLPDPSSGRAWSPIVLDGRQIGAIVYDESLVADPDLVDIAGQVLAIGLDRQRLTVELISSRDALRESRSRIVEADERVRRQLARDLHDGLQGRLVVLAIEAQRLTNQLPAGTEREQAAQLRSGLDVAIDELRGVVYDVMPALLIERGLPAATLEVVERMPIPTELVCDPRIRRLPATIESAAFFVIAEALANGLKHSRADRMSVSLGVEDEVLLVEVADDGVGGAVPRTGGGLGGVADRVEALGGRVRLTSPPGVGTRMVVRLPCAS